MNEYLRRRIMGMGERGDYRRGNYSRPRGRDRAEYPYEDAYEHDRNYPPVGRGVRRDSRMNRREDWEREPVHRADRGYDDYDDYGQFEYNYDMHSEDMSLKKKDIREWERKLENADGSRGPKFTKDQVMVAAQQLGVKFDKFTEEEFTMTVNMMYADYCSALQNAAYPHYQRPEIYAHLAKAWLMDKDFDGEPYEKLALYYHCIVNFDE